MTITHLHLILNHLPVIGILIGIGLAAVALLRKSDDLAKASFALFGVFGITAIFVYLTGEPAEELVRDLPGFSEAVTERHEQVALPATVAAGLLGVVALVTLARVRRAALKRGVISGVLVAALAAEGLMGYTAYLGGQIRHTEVREQDASPEPVESNIPNGQ
jgi:uncharacterized membrane protein